MTAAPPNPFQEIFETRPDLPQNSPLPTLFYFSLSGHDSLHLPPFNQPAEFLKEKAVRVYSFNLPFHLPGIAPSDAMKEWVKKVEEKEDPLETFLAQSKKNIDSLFQQGLVDPERCAAAGLSRGAYAALRLAAEEPRLKTLLAYAPLIDFTHLDEANTPSPFSLFDSVEALVGRSLSLYVGNYDTRVDTDSCYRFIRKLTQASLEKGIRSPEVELNLRPSIGYRGHGTSPETFREGISWLLKKWGIS